MIQAELKDRKSVNSILASDLDRALIFQRFSNYEKFINEYFGNDIILFDNIHYYYLKYVPVANLCISIIGLNSAWLAASDLDQGNLVLGDMQVRQST